MNIYATEPTSLQIQNEFNSERKAKSIFSTVEFLEKRNFFRLNWKKTINI